MDFLEQLTSFRQLLQSAEVLKNETPKTKLNVLNPKINSLQKRGILDIFTPYSVNSIGDTGNRSYVLMNKNFNTIQTTELKLAHQQKLLADNFKTMHQAEIAVSHKK